MPSPKKFLMVFDFDHTVVNDNTDVVVQSLEGFPPLSDEVISSCRTDGWTKYMQRVFTFYSEHGAKKEDYFKVLDAIHFVPGILELLKRLREPELDAEVIIISDSNSEFIGRILKQNGLESAFDKVFTNPAEFNEDGHLIVKPYHHQVMTTLKVFWTAK